MNKIERFVYDIVKSNPKIKKQIRNIYQGVFDLMPRKKNYSVNPIILKEGFFYGFHEVQPFSEDNKKILANKLRYNEVRMPLKDDFIDVGYIKFDGDILGDFVKLGETNAWNFHKGCRLQWINNDEVIYNCTTNDNMNSKIVNIHSGDENIIPFPIDTVSPDGKYATSFSYERLEKHMPGYGYCHKDEYSYIDEKSSNETGLFIVELHTKERKLIVSLDELANSTASFEASNVSDHYVTHSEFSHDSKLISFLHRWTGEYKGKRYTELMIYNLETGKLIRVPTTGQMTSHYDWNNKREIIAYCNYKNQDAHVLLKIDDINDSQFVAYPRLNSDGHQSFINDRSFVTDTYPDKWRMAKLYEVKICDNSVRLLASVYSPKKFQSSPEKGHVACDLHPIVSKDGSFVCFDTVHTGKRSLAIMKLN